MSNVRRREATPSRKPRALGKPSMPRSPTLPRRMQQPSARRNDPFLLYRLTLRNSRAAYTTPTNPRGYNVTLPYFRTDHHFSIMSPENRLVVVRTYAAATSATAARVATRSAAFMAASVEMSVAECFLATTVQVPGVTQPRAPELRCVAA